VEELDAYFQLHQVAAKDAITIIALHLKGMAHDWWFKIPISCYHANIETYDEFTNTLVKIFDKTQCESSCVKFERSNTLHELEENMKQTPLHISRGEENQDDDLLEARHPLYEGHSSICEGMKIFLSKENRNMRSLMEKEAYSHVGEEHVHRRIHSIVSLEGDPSPHGDDRGAISSIGGVLVSMQRILRDTTCGDLVTIHEHHVVALGDCVMDRGEEVKDQNSEGMRIHPHILRRVSSHRRGTELHRG